MKIPSSLIVPSFVLLIPIGIMFAVPYLPLQDPYALNLAAEYEAPSRNHLLGLGENGVDVFSQLLWGCRVSLLISLLTVILSASIGTLLGLVAGFKRGWTDLLVMRLVDFVYAFPGLLLVVALAAFLGPSFFNLVLVMVLSSWAGYARIVRAQVLSLRERTFVQAAEALGAKTSRVMFAHVLPNLFNTLSVQMCFHFGTVILIEGSLSFLGLGVPVGTPSWGQLLNSGRDVIMTAPHIVLAPGLALVLCVFGFNLLGEGLRDYLDPKLQ